MRWLILPVLQSVRLKILMGSFIYLVASHASIWDCISAMICSTPASFRAALNASSVLSTSTAPQLRAGRYSSTTAEHCAIWVATGSESNAKPRMQEACALALISAVSGQVPT